MNILHEKVLKSLWESWVVAVLRHINRLVLVAEAFHPSPVEGMTSGEF
jgi:hypothetical protein